MVEHAITIGGVDVKDYVLNYLITDTFGEMSPADLECNPSILTLFNEDEENEVIISRGDTVATEQYLFRGYIYNIEQQGAEITLIDCKDKLWKLSRISLSISYDIDIDAEAGVISAIAQDLIERGGFTATVVDTGSVLVINKFILRNDNILDKLNQLAKLVDYVVYYNPQDNTVHFEPIGYVDSGQTLEVGVNLVSIPTWKKNYDGIINDIVVVGDEQELETVQSFVAPGGNAIFSLTFKPESVQVYLNSVLQTGGIFGQSSSYDYYVDKENKKIIFAVAPALNDDVDVNYSYLQPIKVRKKNYGSIELYGTYSGYKKINTIQTVEDAENKASEIISKFGGPVFNIDELQVYNNFNLSAGMKVTVNDKVNNRFEEVNITEATYSYPNLIDVYTVDNSPIYTDYIKDIEFSKRIDQLERKNNSDNSLVIQMIDSEHVTTFRRRDYYVDKYKIFDTAYTNHPINGLLDSGIVLDDFETGSAANWTAGADVAVSDNAVTVLVNDGSMQVVISDTGSKTVSTAQSFGNISSYTGESSGTPSQGTCGIWWNSPNTTGITDLKLRLGSSASDYIECSAREYRKVDGYSNFGSLTFGLYSGWNYYLFDLDNPDATSGTPDWTACDYARFEFTVASAHTGYFDAFTVSSGNFIGCPLLDDRSQLITGQVKLLQGKNSYRELGYDTDYEDSSSTASLNTGTHTINFTSGQVWLSENLCVGTVVTDVLVNLGTVVGTLKIEVTGDNGDSYQEVNETVLTALTSTDGTGVKIRITETGSAVASITLTTDANGVVTEPIIKMEMFE